MNHRDTLALPRVNAQPRLAVHVLDALVVGEAVQQHMNPVKTKEALLRSDGRDSIGERFVVISAT